MNLNKKAQNACLQSHHIEAIAIFFCGFESVPFLHYCIIDILPNFPMTFTMFTAPTSFPFIYTCRPFQLRKNIHAQTKLVGVIGNYCY